LGLEISESTVSRYLAPRHSPRDSGQRWLTVLKKYREAIAAMDFFTVPTATFRVLYCFFVIGHGRRQILHFNVTKHPTSAWIVQQLREAFPEDRAPRYLILDRDSKFKGEVATMLEYLGRELVRTAYPWQNGVAERWVGSCRRELLDHVIVLNESHLRRLLRDYVAYYHDDRIHDALKKETPTLRVVERRPRGPAKVVGAAHVGRLHRYHWQAVA
jgi:transposase InsO family protein